VWDITENQNTAPDQDHWTYRSRFVHVLSVKLAPLEVLDASKQAKVQSGDRRRAWTWRKRLVKTEFSDNEFTYMYDARRAAAGDD